MPVLVEWLTAERNFFRWKTGFPLKVSLCDEIQKIMVSYGLPPRKKREFYAKIWSIERSVSCAKDTMVKSGYSEFTPLRELNSEVALAIFRSCPYFEDLKSIMTPKFHPYNLHVTESGNNSAMRRLRANESLVTSATSTQNTLDLQISRRNSADFEADRSISVNEANTDHTNSVNDDGFELVIIKSEIAPKSEIVLVKLEKSRLNLRQYQNEAMVELMLNDRRE